MNAERALANFVREFRRDRIPENTAEVLKRMLLAVAGTAVAGAAEEGCAPLRAMLMERGGKSEATVLVYGSKLPAPSAALVNGVMCRALDFCDSMVPGIHIGSSLIPAAMAAAELKGGCTGSEFLTALVVGAETGARLNLTEEAYDGFDPTGVGAVYAATAVAARILDLDEEQTLNALALAFNRCGGSFQSNVDGSLAVRLIQGWVAESGITCALLARNRFTGPARFLTGVYGYLHLFGKDRFDAGSVVSGLGETWRVDETMFKRYPSCGCTQGITELALQFVHERELEADAIAWVELRLTPYAYRLVGHEFSPGCNPGVAAQFSARYCVANAMTRKASTLEHFRSCSVQDPQVLAFTEKVRVVPDARLDARGHVTAAEIEIMFTTGERRMKRLDVAPGFVGNALQPDEHRARFDDCMRYAAIPLPSSQAGELVAAIESIDDLDDALALIRLLIVPGAGVSSVGSQDLVTNS